MNWLVSFFIGSSIGLCFYAGYQLGQFFEKRTNKIRIYLTYKTMYKEWEDYLDLCGHNFYISFDRFIQIRYNLFAKSQHYQNKIILLGISRNRLETLAILRDKKGGNDEIK